MDRDRWDRIKQIFLDVCEQPPEKRISFLNDTCSDEEFVKNEVIKLLRADGQTVTFLDAKPETVYSLLAGEESGSTSIIGIPDEIGPYKILGETGSGGMGIVYEAIDRRLDRKVALKLLPFYLGDHPDAKQRFIAEAKAASRLDHPNIVTIYEIDETEQGQLYMAMAHYKGETLKSRIEKHRIDPETAIDYMTQIAEGLRAAHNAGIIHCDIKPANIFITEEGRIKILDFGIAQLRDSGDSPAGTAGTLAYMSPGQLRGGPLEPDTDIWSLGVTMYEALTGSRPFNGTNKEEIIENIRCNNKQPIQKFVPPISPPLVSIIERCLQSEPAKRYANGTELLRSLEHETHNQSYSRRRKERVIAYTPVAIIIVLLGFWFFFLHDDAPDTVDNRASVAVLPFVNASGEEEIDFISEGITDELIHLLSGTDGLRVPARTSSYRFRDNPNDYEQISSQLQTEHILQGSLESSDDGLYISVRLINTRSGIEAWSNSYVYDAADALDIQRDISDSVLSRLTGGSIARENVYFMQRQTTNPDAYADYLRGRYQWNKRTNEGISRSIEFFNRALQHDPEFALAYAGLAQSYVLKVWYTGTMPDETYPLARSAALRALSIDDRIASAHATLGSIYWQYERNLAAAGDAFRKAIDLDPNDATTCNWFGEFLVYTGNFEEGIRLLDRALTIDPLSLITIVDKGTAYLLLRDFNRAIDYYTMALEVEPRFALARVFKGMALEATGNYDEAVVEIERAITDGGANPLWLTVLARAYAVAGNSTAARELLRDLHAEKEKRFISPFALALVYSALGEHDNAIGLLQRAIEVNDPFLVYIDTHPLLDQLREDHRFHDLAAGVWNN